MTSERGGRNLSVEWPRVPGEGSSAQGYSGPKARSKDVVDGQQVDIPVPPFPRQSRTCVAKEIPSGTTEPRGIRPPMGRRRKVSGPGRWSSRGKRVGSRRRKIRGGIILRRDADKIGCKPLIL